MSNKASTVGSVVNTVGVVAVCVALSAFIQGGSKDFWYTLLAGAIGLLVICAAGYIFFGPVKNKQKLLEYKQRHEKMKAVIADCMKSSGTEPPPKRRYSTSSVELVRQAERETLRQRRQGENSAPAREREERSSNERSSSRQARSPNTQQATRPPRPKEQSKAVRPSKDATNSRSRKPKDEQSLPLFTENELLPARKDLVADEFFL